MTIEKNARTLFLFPTCLIVNRLTAGLIRRKLKKDGINLTRRQTRLFIKEIKRYKKNHADWVLVEIKTENGDLVTVKI